MSDSIITVPSHHKDVRWTTREFDYTGHVGWGYSYDVTPEGEPKLTNEAQRRGYIACLADVKAGTMVDRGNVQHEVLSVFVPARGMCSCGAEIILDGGGTGLGNACECGLMYNMSGERVNYITEAGFEETGGSSICGESW